MALRRLPSASCKELNLCRSAIVCKRVYWKETWKGEECLSHKTQQFLVRQEHGGNTEDCFLKQFLIERLTTADPRSNNVKCGVQVGGKETVAARKWCTLKITLVDVNIDPKGQPRARARRRCAESNKVVYGHAQWPPRGAQEIKRPSN